MTKDEVLQRTVFVQASKKPAQGSRINANRRGNNFTKDIEIFNEESSDSFFDFEKEMMELKPSREQFIVEPNFSNLIVPEEQTEAIDEPVDPTGFVIMEEVKTPFEFVQCHYVKDDGARCKKQAKKGHEYCGAHRKMLEK